MSILIWENISFWRNHASSNSFCLCGDIKITGFYCKFSVQQWHYSNELIPSSLTYHLVELLFHHHTTWQIILTFKMNFLLIHNNSWLVSIKLYPFKFTSVDCGKNHGHSIRYFSPFRHVLFYAQCWGLNVFMPSKSKIWNTRPWCGWW